jgi:hypothetical protein
LIWKISQLQLPRPLLISLLLSGGLGSLGGSTSDLLGGCGLDDTDGNGLNKEFIK